MQGAFDEKKVLVILLVCAFEMLRIKLMLNGRQVFYVLRLHIGRIANDIIKPPFGKIKRIDTFLFLLRDICGRKQAVSVEDIFVKRRKDGVEARQGIDIFSFQQLQ